MVPFYTTSALEVIIVYVLFDNYYESYYIASFINFLNHSNIINESVFTNEFPNPMLHGLFIQMSQMSILMPSMYSDV